ncbi:hypothetical protein AAGS61_08660 [Lysinibacillus sp. KU-BSD001]|uniref:hypothetical protein n=1 Tax=Lysinibacillus sp. KU-BSD001 TaxID=3141328 RepID=UPI0036EE1FE1
MEEIKAFIEYAEDMKKQIKEAFERSMELELFSSHQIYIRLQNEVTDRAREIGILSIIEGLEGLQVHFSNSAFHALGLTDVNTREINSNGECWIHYSVVIDGIILTACELKTSEEHKKAQAL